MPEKNRFPAVLMPVSGQQRQWPAEVAPTLQAQFGDKLGLENQHIDSNAGGLFVPDMAPLDGGVSPTITAANNPSRSPQSSEVTAQVAAVLQAESARGSVVCFEPGVASRDGGHVYYDVCGTIRREPGDNRMTVAFHPTQDPISSEGVCHSLSAGTKNGCSTAAAMYFTAAEVRHTGTVKGDTIAGTLTSQTKRGDTEPCVVQAMGTDCYNGAITGDVAATMGTPGSSVNASGPTVMQFNPTESVAFDTRCGLAPHGSASEGNTVFPLTATNHKDPQITRFPMVVRRLTPLECERLQGFPDGHTDITVKNKPAADAPRYKALGNSMAVNCMQFLGERIQMVEDRHDAN